jgi:hypothetical protein
MGYRTWIAYAAALDQNRGDRLPPPPVCRAVLFDAISEVYGKPLPVVERAVDRARKALAQSAILRGPSVASEPGAPYEPTWADGEAQSRADDEVRRFAPAGHAYTFHSDPGHGWLEVPMDEIRALGIADQISRYSYMTRDRSTAYLEEDCDMARFAHARGWTPGGDAPIRDKSYNGECFIRNLPSFQPI